MTLPGRCVCYRADERLSGSSSVTTGVIDGSSQPRAPGVELELKRNRCVLYVSDS